MNWHGQAPIVPCAPARRSAGLHAFDQRSGELGDVIVAVNGRPLETLSTFVVELDRLGVDSTAERTVERYGKQRRVRVRAIDLRG